MRIKVKNLQTGQTGTIPEENYDASLYEKVDAKLPGMVEGAIRFGGNVAGGAIGQRVGTPIGAGIGAIGGPTGAAIGAGTGAYAGSVAGGGAGSVGAEALLNLIGDIMNKRNIDITDSNYEDRFKEGASGQAIGIPIAKGLGYLAHPIAPFTKNVASKLSKSVKSIDFDELLKMWKPQMASKFAQDTVGSDAAPILEKIPIDVLKAVAEKRVHSPEGVSNVLNLTKSNEIKSALQKSVSKYYGKGSGEVPAESIARKDLARTLKQTIEKLEPGVKIPNAIASFLHQLDITSAMKHSYGFPGSAVLRLTGYTADPIRKGIQKAIPEGGGYLNQLFPGLLSQPQQ